MVWLASGVYLFVAKGVNFPAGIVFASFLISWGYGTMETIWRIKKEGFLNKVLFAAIIALVICGFGRVSARL